MSVALTKAALPTIPDAGDTLLDATVTTAVENIDLKAIRGKIVRIRSDVQLVVSANGSAAIASVTDPGIPGAANCGLVLDADTDHEFFIPKGDPNHTYFLKYRGVTSSGYIHIWVTSQ